MNQPELIFGVGESSRLVWCASKGDASRQNRLIDCRSAGLMFSEAG